jgi:hypothetical protein
MDKGVTPMQNIICLKWSAYYHVAVSWNILLGFPGETNEDYQRQIDLIPSLFHLHPPEATGKFWLQRFSPYHTKPHEYGIRITGPWAAYEYVYDTKRVDVRKIAYDFEYELDNWNVDPHIYQELVDLVQEWQQRTGSIDRPFLYYSKAMDYVTVYDGRNPTTPIRRRYDWPAAGIIEVCNEAAKSVEQIRTLLAHRPDRSAIPDGEIDQALGTLTAARILYEERGKYFTLAVPENPYL